MLLSQRLAGPQHTLVGLSSATPLDTQDREQPTVRGRRRTALPGVGPKWYVIPLGRQSPWQDTEQITYVAGERLERSLREGPVLPGHPPFPQAMGSHTWPGSPVHLYTCLIPNVGSQNEANACNECMVVEVAIAVTPGAGGGSPRGGPVQSVPLPGLGVTASRAHFARPPCTTLLSCVPEYSTPLVDREK